MEPALFTKIQQCYMHRTNYPNEEFFLEDLHDHMRIEKKKKK